MSASSFGQETVWNSMKASRSTGSAATSKELQSRIWQNGDSGKGVVFAGDIIRVVGDPKWVTFMYSYPNFIPLPSQTVRRIAAYMKGVPFNRMYDAFNRRIQDRADEAVQKSADRYVAALEGTLFET